jgi:hypothetical protein
MGGDLGEEVDRSAGSGSSRGLGGRKRGGGRYYSSTKSRREDGGSEGWEGGVCTGRMLVMS